MQRLKKKNEEKLKILLLPQNQTTIRILFLKSAELQNESLITQETFCRCIKKYAESQGWLIAGLLIMVWSGIESSRYGLGAVDLLKLKYEIELS